jgi:hypothetical protein
MFPRRLASRGSLIKVVALDVEDSIETGTIILKGDLPC